MKTIQFLSQAIRLAQQVGTPANIEVGTFKVISNGTLHHAWGRTGTFDGCAISFQLEFNPTHIQRLLEMGVIINFDSAKMAGLSEKALRFKAGREAIRQGRYAPYYYMGNPANQQTGVVDNTLHAQASCSIQVLESLLPFCRFNHLHHVSIDNDFQLAAAGWKLTQRIQAPSKPDAEIAEFGKLIRRNTHDKRKSVLLPIEKRAMTKKYSY